MRKLLLAAAATVALVGSVSANVTNAEARPFHHGRFVVRLGGPIIPVYRHHYFRPVFLRCHTQNIIRRHHLHRAQVCNGRVTRIW